MGAGTMIVQQDSQRHTVIRLTRSDRKELHWILKDWKHNAMDDDDHDHPNYKERMKTYLKWMTALGFPEP
jgi:hypothetical protein